MLAIESERGAATAAAATGCQVFGVALGDEAHTDVLALITALRRAGVHADMAFAAAEPAAASRAR